MYASVYHLLISHLAALRSLSVVEVVYGTIAQPALGRPCYPPPTLSLSAANLFPSPSLPAAPPALSPAILPTPTRRTARPIAATATPAACLLAGWLGGWLLLLVSSSSPSLRGLSLLCTRAFLVFRSPFASRGFFCELLMIHITDSYLCPDSVFLFSSRLSLLSNIYHLRSFPFLPLGVLWFFFWFCCSCALWRMD